MKLLEFIILAIIILAIITIVFLTRDSEPVLEPILECQECPTYEPVVGLALELECEPEIIVLETIKPVEVIKEVVKEVPIEVLVEKIVYIDRPIIQECPICLSYEEEPYIILVDIDTSETSAEVRWQTTLPTISTMFLWKEGDESFDVFNYNSYTNNPSTRHKVVVEHLEPNQKYIAEIEAVLGQKTAKTKIKFITIQE